MKEIKSKDIRFYGKTIIGPVILPFTEWIISEARKKGIKRIYFLSRDGYLLFETAKRICEKKRIEIDCRYLYCSRQALRTASYHLIGDEAIELLTMGGYHVTKKSIIERAGLSKDEVEQIIKALKISDINTQLTEKELKNFRSMLKKCSIYKALVIRHSKESYNTTIEYLRQEGLFEEKKVAIADSGWTGSMQRTLRQLLESVGVSVELHGFYFGMYASPKEKADGEYNTFYFNHKSGLLRKVAFNNNLFECMLSAPHGMAKGYKKREDGCIKPMLTDTISQNQLRLVSEQINGAIEYIDDNISHISTFVYKKAVKKVKRILNRYMVYPSKNFADIYGAFAFCDDVTEGYHISLADPSQQKVLKNYMLIPRILRKFFNKKPRINGELYWPYGVIAFCPFILRPWYRFNIKAWNLLKSILK